MPDHTPVSAQHTFIVRLWWEWEGAGSDRTRGWRGRVEHVQSGEGITFREMHQLFTFINGFIASFPPLPFDQTDKGIDC